MLKRIIPFALLLAFAGCSENENITENPASSEGPSKPPLEFDESSILVPPDLDAIRAKFRSRVAEDQAASKALPKVASNYYTFGMHNGVGFNDYTAVYPNWGSAHCPGDHSITYPRFWNSGCPQNVFMEATYSWRFNSYPEALWSNEGIGTGVQTGDLGDYEQAELHFVWDMTTATQDYIYVTVNYEVQSELNYDYLWINSTGHEGICNSPGTVQRKVSGYVPDGTITFTIPKSCGQGWLGLYFIKDYSLSHYGDFAKIKSVRIN